MNNLCVRAGVIGARGYTGRELVRLIGRHPVFELAFATSERGAGEEVAGAARGSGARGSSERDRGVGRDVGGARVGGGAASVAAGGVAVASREGANGAGALRYVTVADAPRGEADLIFTCLPTGRAGEWSLRARADGARVVDLSQDLRPAVAGTPAPGGAVYGLPELWRTEVGGSDLVANPGCYVTGALLALAPGLSCGLVDAGRPIVVDAASGVTGAGRRARTDLLFGEVAEDFRAYGTGNRHRHVPELQASLARVAGGVSPSLVFTPHLLPVRRGILETIYVPLDAGVTWSDAAEAWTGAYAGEPFVRVLPWNESEPRLPSLGDAVGTHGVVIGLSPVEMVEPPMLLVVAALDNLLKGAASQAVQNANLMFGLDEREGLDPWV